MIKYLQPPVVVSIGIFTAGAVAVGCLLVLLVLATRPTAMWIEAWAQPTQSLEPANLVLPPQLPPHQDVSFLDDVTGKSSSKFSTYVRPDNHKHAYLDDL